MSRGSSHARVVDVQFLALDSLEEVRNRIDKMLSTRSFTVEFTGNYPVDPPEVHTGQRLVQPPRRDGRMVIIDTTGGSWSFCATYETAGAAARAINANEKDVTVIITAGDGAGGEDWIEICSQNASGDSVRWVIKPE